MNCIPARFFVNDFRVIADEGNNSAYQRSMEVKTYPTPMMILYLLSM